MYQMDGDQSHCTTAVAAQAKVLEHTLAHAKHPSSKDTTVAGRTFLSVQHTTAVVLDWCYDTLDAATLTKFVNGLKGVANMDAPGFPIDWGPPPRWDTIVGHPCEGWIFTGQLPAGL